MTKNIKAEIITIGDELLIGQVIDTNSAWIARELNSIGIVVAQITSISDTQDQIINSLTAASERVNLVLVTGGLGPTNDDITKIAINEYFNTHFIKNQQVLNHIEKLLFNRGLPMNRLNIAQADVPEKATILPNSLGTAPGLWLEHNKIIYVFMPGVPYEMKSIFSNELIPQIKNQFSGPSIFHKTLMLYGIAESVLALRIEEWESSLPSTIKLAYLPSLGTIRLRLTAMGEANSKLEDLISFEVKKLLPLIKDYYFGNDDETLEIVVGKLLKDNNKTVATAESCTGGTVAGLLTSNSGSSAFFKGGIIAYSNEVKTSVLKVDESILHNYGAVSEQVVRVMAEETLELMQVDYSVSVSGVSGPDGGTPEKPVGTVWIGIASKNSVHAVKFNFENDRARNIKRAANAALNELRKMILSDIEKKHIIV